MGPYRGWSVVAHARAASRGRPARRARSAQRAWIIAALIGLTAVACDEEGPAPTESLITDSAGVRIVTHPAGPRDTLWVSEAALTIGTEGDTLYEFYRVVAVEALTDGRIVVASGGTNELLYYAADGTYLTRAGGRGEGPGEFGFLSQVQRWRGDTMVVSDPRARRVSFFSPEPAYSHALSWADETDGMPEGAGACFGPGYAGLIDGPRLALWGWGCIFPEGGEGVRSFTMTMRIRDAAGGEDAEIGPFGVARAYERPTENPRLAFPSVPLTGPRGIDVSEQGLFISEFDAFQIDHYGPGGHLLTRIRDMMPRRPITAAMEADYLDNLPEPLREAALGVPVPDSLSAFNSLIVTGGGIWARHMPVPADTVVLWSAYSSDATEVRRFAFPAAFALSSVSDDLAYGTVRDEFDVERIRVYRLPEGG